MHTKYKEISFKEMQRVVGYCQNNSALNGGIFEVYSMPGEDMHMIVINSSSPQDESFRPLGGFYCNYLGPGVISLENEDPNFDGAESRKRHVAAVKQAIDIILEKGFPGTTLNFNY
ncbi:MAG: hypothetical protein ACQ9MH_04375 [Nitrospinales bacterium]